MMRSSTRGVVAVLALLVMSACSATGSPGSSSSNAPSSGESEKIIYFGSGSVPGSPEDYLVPLFTTARKTLEDKGYQFSYSPLSNDEVVEAAIDRGRIDVALLSMVGAQRAIKAGLHMKWVLTNETQNTFVLVVHKDVDDLTQLKGKKIGSQDATSLSTAAIPGILGPAGLSLSDYTISYLAGSSNRAAALSSGSLDASMLLYTIAVQLIDKSNGEFKIWGGGAASGPAMDWEGFVMSDAFRQTQGAKDFVAAMLDAYQKYYGADPAAMAKEAVGIEQLAGLEEESAAADLKLYQDIKLFPLDGGVSKDLFSPMIDTLKSVNQLKEADVVPYESVVDTSLVDAAKK
jgi:ABC-type nitrate/sulfonate/bicarbonate transport system substrate-binding protein